MNGLYLITIAASNFPPFPLMDEKIPKPTQIPKMGDWSALDGWGYRLGEWRALKLMKCNWSMDGMHWMNFGVHLG
jgi:hypothetical protein